MTTTPSSSNPSKIEQANNVSVDGKNRNETTDQDRSASISERQNPSRPALNNDAAPFFPHLNERQNEVLVDGNRAAMNSIVQHQHAHNPVIDRPATYYPNLVGPYEAYQSSQQGSPNYIYVPYAPQFNTPLQNYAHLNSLSPVMQQGYHYYYNYVPYRLEYPQLYNYAHLNMLSPAMLPGYPVYHYHAPSYGYVPFRPESINTFHNSNVHLDSVSNVHLDSVRPPQQKEHLRQHFSPPSNGTRAARTNRRDEDTPRSTSGNLHKKYRSKDMRLGSQDPASAWYYNPAVGYFTENVYNKYQSPKSGFGTSLEYDHKVRRGKNKFEASTSSSYIHADTHNHIRWNGFEETCEPAEGLCGICNAGFGAEPGEPDFGVAFLFRIDEMSSSFPEVSILPCGHAFHSKCFAQNTLKWYPHPACLICSKDEEKVSDISEGVRSLDIAKNTE